jgi:Calcineurin-like phosphoesterase
VRDSGQPDGRVAVVGDIGGHADELRRELGRLGADPRTGRLPDDLTVVQVGDLVHRGPDSERVIVLVDRYLREQPGQWVQLLGNHEAHYVREPVFEWPQRLSRGSVDTLHRWWQAGQFRVAASVVTDTETFVVTHAGVTAGFWRDVLGSTTDPRTAEAALNGLIGGNEAALFLAGHMLSGKRKNHGAGPIWAAAATELVPSWVGEPMPFSQIHGHSTLYDWHHRHFRASATIARLADLDEEAKHETVALSGGRIVGVDPGHGQRPVRPWRAYELSGTVSAESPY